MPVEHGTSTYRFELRLEASSGADAETVSKLIQAIEWNLTNMSFVVPDLHHYGAHKYKAFPTAVGSWREKTPMIVGSVEIPEVLMKYKHAGVLVPDFDGVNEPLFAAVSDVAAAEESSLRIECLSWFAEEHAEPEWEQHFAEPGEQ